MTADKNEVVSREQVLFWQEFFQLKIDACYVREYRNDVGKWVTRFAALRAITSTSSIAIWAVWKQLPYLWAGLIAAAQVADALKNVFPFVKRRRALSTWSNGLNRMFVDAQRDWDSISSGEYSNAKIRITLHRLRSRKQALEARCIPDGLERKNNLFQKAEQEAISFFQSRYNLPQEEETNEPKQLP